MIRVLLDGHNGRPDPGATVKVTVSVLHLSLACKAGPLGALQAGALCTKACPPAPLLQRGSEGDREGHTLEHPCIPSYLSFQARVPPPWWHISVLRTQNNSVKDYPRPLGTPWR